MNRAQFALAYLGKRQECSATSFLINQTKSQDRQIRQLLPLPLLLQRQGLLQRQQHHQQLAQKRQQGRQQGGGGGVHIRSHIRIRREL